eukprot:490943-Rhodomonas_salina.1
MSRRSRKSLRLFGYEKVGFGYTANSDTRNRISGTSCTENAELGPGVQAKQVDALIASSPVAYPAWQLEHTPGLIQIPREGVADSGEGVVDSGESVADSGEGVADSGEGVADSGAGVPEMSLEGTGSTRHAQLRALVLCHVPEPCERTLSCTVSPDGVTLSEARSVLLAVAAYASLVPGIA